MGASIEGRSLKLLPPSQSTIASLSAHPGPRRQVHDRVDVPSVQDLQDRVRVADVRLDERKGVGRKVLDALLLDGPG